MNLIKCYQTHSTWYKGARAGGELLPGYTAETVIMTINEEISYESIWEGDPKRPDESLYAQSVLLTSPSGTTFKLAVSDEGYNHHLRDTWYIDQYGSSAWPGHIV
jgi:hypothetical protein